MQVRNKVKAREEGFSLIEVMVAIVILTIGLLSLAQMMVLATSSNTLAGRMTSATGLAKEQLERLKAIPFYPPPVTPGSLVRNPLLNDGGDINATVGGYAAFYDSNGNQVAEGVSLYTVRWEITTVVGTGGNGTLPMSTLRIRVRCLPTNAGDQFMIIGDARYVTFRTANIG